MTAEKDFDSAISLGEKLLQKHPNHFTVVYQTGMAHFARSGYIGSKAAPDSIFRAQTLLNRALALFDQNADPSVTEWQIRTAIAETHLFLWDLEKAVNILRENNPGGVNDSRIAHILSDILHRPDEALPYIKQSFQRLMQDLVFTMIALSGYFFCHKDHDRDLDSILWIIRTLESLRPDDGFCDLDPLITTLMQAMCEIHLWHDYDPAQAKDWMKRAYRAAKAYDAASPGEIVGCRFLDDRLDISRFHTGFFGNGPVAESLTQRLHWATPEDEPEYYRIFEEAVREVDEEESP